jgi:hypothetical protein
MVREIYLEDDPLWYKDAVIYELQVRSYYDGNGDGIGDFNGLIHPEARLSSELGDQRHLALAYLFFAP